jgi:hypothetical protein
MAERAGTDAQRERATARERRRGFTSQPFEALDEAARDDSGNGGGPLAAAKQAARTAAAAAIAGGLAGAAKALVERRRRGDDDEQDEAEREPAAEERVGPAGEEPDGDGAVDSAAEEAENAPAGEADATDDDDEEEAPPVAAQDQRPSTTDRDQPERGASASEAREVVDRARSHVAGLLGKEADSVSGISRGNGSWTVTVEVVEVHRVPESTDVLSSYEVVLDDDGDLLSLERRGRYRRSQVEEGR